MKIEIECDYCKRKFWRAESRIKKNKKHNFCSRECKDRYLKVNGKENRRYNRKMQNKLKRLKAERDRRLRLQQ